MVIEFMDIIAYNRIVIIFPFHYTIFRLLYSPCLPKYIYNIPYSSSMKFKILTERKMINDKRENLVDDWCLEVGYGYSLSYFPFIIPFSTHYIPFTFPNTFITFPILLV